MQTPVNLKLLTNLRHGIVRWSPGDRAWSEFRAMVPLALIGGFSMDAHIAALAKTSSHWSTALNSCYEAGIKDWLGIRRAENCVLDKEDWRLFLLEYKAALCVSPESFENSHPAKLVFKAMEEIFLWRTDLFGTHLPHRLQLALLHIEHLPDSRYEYDKELEIWHKASPQLRVEASPEVGAYYNLMQDPQMLQWHLKNIHAPATPTYELPDHFEQGAVL